MSLLKEIQANANAAWSPVKRKSNLLALGSRGDSGVGFENTGGEFKLVSIDFKDSSLQMNVINSVKTPNRFTSLAWRDVIKHNETCPYGVVAGGMSDGTVSFWNPKAMEDKKEPKEFEVGKVSRHKGCVNDLQFNPHDDSSHLIASGGSDGEVYIMSLEKLSNPAVFTPSGGSITQGQINEITSVAWNTQVNYILATGTQNGSVVIWDLKQKKPWCEMRDPQRGTVSAIVWNPREGLQIATASGDDQRPVIKLWDLRNSTTTPLAEFNEHTAGILSLSWCPNDPGLVLSCAKDNRTLLWDIYSRQSMFEFPSEQSHTPTLGSDQFFGGGSGQRRIKVQWSPRIPAVASACTLDGKVQVWGLAGGGNPACRAPRWMRRPVGATFGFGGKLITIGNPKEPIGANSDRRRLIHLHYVVTEHSAVQDAEELDRSLESKDPSGLCDRKAATATTEDSKNVWRLMKILFEKDARQHLLLYLGLDAEKIRQANQRFAPEQPSTSPSTAVNDLLTQNDVSLLSFLTLNQAITQTLQNGAAAEDVFSAGPQTESTTASTLDDLSDMGSSLPDDDSKRLEIVPVPIYTEKSESILMQALLVGNFELAVNCCLHYNQFADALLLASCGGPELWDKTQRAFFEHQKRPVMHIVSAIIRNELLDLVESSNPKEWRETLAMLSTYAKSEEFPGLCDKLAERLEAAGDLSSATLCYMCAVNVAKTVNAWVRECQSESGTFGRTYALQKLVEKVSVFCQAVDQAEQSMTPEVSRCIAEYATLLATQGRLDIAAKYARYSDLECAILRDRIYNAAPQQGYQPPPFPFEVFDIPVHAQNTQQQYGQTSLQNSNQYAQAAPSPNRPSAGVNNTPGYSAFQSAKYPAGRETTSMYSASQHASPYNAPQEIQSYASHSGRGGGPQQQTGYSVQQPGIDRGPSYPAAPIVPSQAQQSSAYPAVSGVSTQGQQPNAPYPMQQNAYAPSNPSNAAYQAAPVPNAAYPGAPTPNAPYPGQQPGFPTASGGVNTNLPVAPMYPSDSTSYNASPPVMQSTGVNSLAAATSLSTSRISTPSVDMSSQKKDGFVSSVGNRELTLKYGNTPSATLSPVKASAGGSFASDLLLGSTQNISQQDLAIVKTFDGFIAQIQSLPLTMLEQKQMSEIKKAKDIMHSKLNAGILSAALVAQLHDMCQCFTNADFASAQQIYVGWTTTEWTQHKDWLRGLKGLIHLAMKRLR